MKEYIICVFLMKVYDMIWKWTWVGFGKIDSVRCADAFFQHLATRKSARVGGHAEPRLRRTSFTSFPTWRSWPTNMERRNKNDENTTWTRHEHVMNTTCAEMAGKCADVWTMAQYGNVWHIKYGRIRSNELYLSWRYSAAGQSHKEQYGSLVFLGLPKNFIGAFFEGPRACSFLLARGGGTLKPSDWLGQQLLFILIADLKQLWQQNNSENEPWYEEICEVFVFHVWNLTQFVEETQGLPSPTGRKKHGL